MAVIGGLTDLRRGLVTIESGSLRFPSGCIFCERTETQAVTIVHDHEYYGEYSSDLKSYQLTLSLCTSHARDYQARKRNQERVFFMILSAGILFVVFALWFGSYYPSHERWALAIPIVVMTTFIAAWGYWTHRPIPLPLHVRSVSFAKYAGTALVFKFENSLGAERLFAANDSGNNSSMPALSYGKVNVGPEMSLKAVFISFAALAIALLASALVLLPALGAGWIASDLYFVIIIIGSAMGGGIGAIYGKKQFPRRWDGD